MTTTDASAYPLHDRCDLALEEEEGWVKRTVVSLVATALLCGLATPASADPHCKGGTHRDAAMWLSIGHPGLGEYYLRHWGNFWDHAPQKKFWLGFIPIYGWPGYLQVKSAIDSHHCRTNDDLTFRH